MYVARIDPRSCSGDDLIDELVAPVEPSFAGELVVVSAPPSDPPLDRVDAAVRRLATLPCVVVGTEAWDDAPDLIDLVDAVADHRALAAIADAVETTPLAATSLAVHLRGSVRRPVAEGLIAESTLFSTLQAGPEHRAWRQASPRRRHADDGRPRVRLTRTDDELEITLTRPEAHNALDVRMRDELLEALAVAEAEPELRVVVRGEGVSFCAGGDLDAFGTTPDPATAHVVRLTRSIGAVLARLAERTTVHLQGTCAGSGIELPAFAGRIVAAPDTRISLPELDLGLVPGAGGTVSIPARIGRHRTAWLALTGHPIGAETARSWGLVDEIGLL